MSSHVMLRHHVPGGLLTSRLLAIGDVVRRRSRSRSFYTPGAPDWEEDHEAHDRVEREGGHEVERGGVTSPGSRESDSVGTFHVTL
jgi:hypothetical protein